MTLKQKNTLQDTNVIYIYNKPDERAIHFNYPVYNISIYKNKDLQRKLSNV
jgi:hypothetical protein